MQSNTLACPGPALADPARHPRAAGQVHQGRPLAGVAAKPWACIIGLAVAARWSRSRMSALIVEPTAFSGMGEV